MTNLIGSRNFSEATLDRLTEYEKRRIVAAIAVHDNPTLRLLSINGFPATDVNQAVRDLLRAYQRAKRDETPNRH